MHLIKSSEFFPVKSTCANKSENLLSVGFFSMTFPVIINGWYNKRLDSNHNMWQQQTNARRGHVGHTPTYTHYVRTEHRGVNKVLESTTSWY